MYEYKSIIFDIGHRCDDYLRQNYVTFLPFKNKNHVADTV